MELTKPIRMYIDQEKIRALLLAAVMLFSVFAATVAFAGSAAH